MSKRTADPERPAAPPDDDVDDDAPEFGRRAFGGPTASSWREQALTRIAELEDLTDLFRDPADPRKELLAQRIHRHLATARRAAGGSSGSGWARLKATVGGSPVERTASNVDAAEADVLRLAPAGYLHGQLPSILAATRSHLRLDDPRRQQLEAICARQGGQPLTTTERDFVIAASRAAASAARREILQVRSFRNILYSATTVLTVAVVALVIIGAANSTLIPLCFTPENAVVCATNVTSPVDDDVTPEELNDEVRETTDGWDIPLVALLGLIAAAVSSAISLRNLRGTSTPYALPLAVAVLKLPSGALTAVLGLLLMRGGFVPGLSALDTPAQILAWAVLFGSAQQLFTRFVDARAHTVLDEVGGQEQPRRPDTAVVTRVAPPPEGGGNGLPPADGAGGTGRDAAAGAGATDREGAAGAGATERDAASKT